MLTVASPIPALLPLKGHSERVPNKNLRTFAGRPLYHRVASVLEQSPLVSEIVVNTDSREIANDARRNFEKVRIIDRPSSLQGGHVPMEAIVECDLEHLDSEHFLQTHATSPLLTLETLESAIQTYFSELPDRDSLFTVREIRQRLYWRDGSPVNHQPGVVRTQDLEPILVRNACLYVLSRTAFFSAGSSRIGKRPYLFVMDDVESIDVDEETDFLIAEAAYLALRKDASCNKGTGAR